MKIKVRRFKGLAVGLKELERFIRNGQHLTTGRPFKTMSMLSREALGNWLLCAVLTDSSGRPYCFTSDPGGGDGIVYDEANKADYPTEHVYVREVPKNEAATASIDALILTAVSHKESKGKAYAEGKTLVVFLNAGLGEWHPNKVARALPAGNFSTVWVVGLDHIEDSGAYVYGVTCVRTGTSQPACGM